MTDLLYKSDAGTLREARTHSLDVLSWKVTTQQIAHSKGSRGLTVMVMAMVAAPAAIPAAPAMVVVVVVVPVTVVVMVAPAPVQQVAAVVVACTGTHHVT